MEEGEPGQFADRRSDVRTATVYRPVLIETDDIAGFCLVRNLSPEGMMGKFYTHFAEGTRVSVQFNEILKVAGKVAWSRDRMIGIQFATSINVQEVLAGLAGLPQGGKAVRAPRLQIQTAAQVIVDGRPVYAELQDISQKGVKIRTSYLRPSDDVTILLDGMEPKKAVVRWTQPGVAGLNFINPLPFDQLGEWVIQLQQHAAQRPKGADRSAAGDGRAG